MASQGRSMTQAPSPPPVLRAKFRDVRVIASLLRPIAFAQICQVVISDPGLQVTTGVNGTVQASAYIGHGLFDEFEYNPEAQDLPSSDVGNGDDDEEGAVPVSTFDVSLANWLSCLNIYGTAAGNASSAPQDAVPKAGGQDSVRGFNESRRAPFAKGKTIVEMTYAGHGHPLILQLNEGQVNTQCHLSTFDADTSAVMDMPFNNSRAIGQIIMQSRDLSEALLSIDTSSQAVTFEFVDESENDQNSIVEQVARNGERAGSAIATDPPSTLQMSTQNEHQSGLPLPVAAAHRIYGRETHECLRIMANNDHGSTEMTFPNRKDVFQSFSMMYASRHRYAFATLKHCFKALQTSLKTSVRIDDQGMMCLQCLFPDRPLPASTSEDANDESPPGPERKGFVEIRLASLLSTDD